MALEHDATTGFRDVALPPSATVEGSFPQNGLLLILTVAALLVLGWCLFRRKVAEAPARESRPLEELSFAILRQKASADIANFSDLTADLAALLRIELSRFTNLAFDMCSAEEIATELRHTERFKRFLPVSDFLTEVDRLRFSGNIPRSRTEFLEIVLRSEQLIDSVATPPISGPSLLAGSSHAS